MKPPKDFHGFYGSCYHYETEEPEDEWHFKGEMDEFRWFSRFSRKLAVQVWLLRKLGVKNGMCCWPPKWFEKPIRVLFHPWKSIKNQLWWWFKSNV